MTDLPPCPNFPLRQIFQTRDEIVRRCDCVGELLTYNRLREWANNMALVLRVPADVVLQSCRHLTDQSLSNGKLVEIAWRLAANTPELVAGRAVLEAREQPVSEWVAIQILEVNPQSKQTKGRPQPGAVLQLKFLTGRLASRQIPYWLSSAQCGLLAWRSGFTAASKQRPFQRSTLLTCLRVACYLLPPGGQAGKICHIGQLDCPPALEAYNRTILKLRYRSSMACPFGYTHECCECAVGYDNCEAATHPTTYVLRVCMLCNNPQALFDPRDPAMCLQCREKG